MHGTRAHQQQRKLPHGVCPRTLKSRQKRNFKANCRMRGELTVLEMIPKDERVERFDPGFAKFGWLNRLKASTRSSSLIGSRIGNALATERSVFQNPGPVKKFLGEFPKYVPFPITGGGAKAVVLK